MAWWKSTGTKWRRLRRRTPHEQFLCVQAALLLPIVAAGLAVAGLGRMQRLLVCLSQAPRLRADDAERLCAREIAWAVEASARHAPYRANCLHQSLLVWWLLRRHGLASEIRIGVRRDGEALQAHAWVECDGRTLIDAADGQQRFTAFDRAISPAASEPS